MRAGLYGAVDGRHTRFYTESCSLDEAARGIGRAFPSTTTFATSQQEDFTMIALHPSISSAAAIPASPPASPETVAEKATRATSGRRCVASYESSGRDGSFARTFLDTLNSVSTPYSMTWALLDTPRRRSLFRLAPSGRLIGGTVYGLLPTPLASHPEPLPSRAR